MGLDLVPPTVLRDGPLGEGSVQWFVEADHQQHYFTIYEDRPDLHDRLRTVALFDLVANNTDRKSGHVLIDGDDHIWGIDHGLCFAADFKLRTVIWEFGGEPIPTGWSTSPPIRRRRAARRRHAAGRRRGRGDAGACRSGSSTTRSSRSTTPAAGTPGRWCD